MKITQLDYSAIMNANAARFSAKRTETANMANKTYLENYAKLEQANQNASIFQTIYDLGTNAFSIAETYKKAQEEKDLTDANSVLSDIGANAEMNISRIISDEGQIARFDDNGNVVFSDSFENYLTTERTRIEDLDIGQSVKDQALAKFDEFATAARNQYATDLYQRNIEAIATSRQNQLSEAAIVDSQGDGTGAMGLSIIDSWTDLSTIERDNIKYAYEKNVKNTNRRNTAISLARDSGLDDALEYIRSLDGITEEDRLSLESLAYSTNSDENTKQAQIFANAFSQQLQNGKQPYEIRQEMETALSATDADRRDAVKMQIDQVQMSYASEQLPKFNMDTASVGTLTGYRNSISEGGKFGNLFYGIEEYRDALIASVDEKIEARKTLEQSEQKKYDNEVLQYSKNYINGLEKMIQNGQVSAQEAINLARNLAESTPDYSDDLLVQDMVRDFSSIVPDQYKTLVNTFLDDFEQSYRKYAGVKDDEFSADVMVAVDKARADLLELFYTTATQNMTYDQITERMEQINQGYMGKVIAKLGKVSLPEQTLIEQGVLSYSTKDLSKTITLLSDNKGGIYENSEGNIRFRNDQTEESYYKVMEAGIYVLDKLGKQVQFVRPMRDASDEPIPVPVFETTDGETFTLDNQSNVMMLDEKGAWTAFRNVYDMLNEKPKNNASGNASAYLAGGQAQTTQLYPAALNR